MFLVTGSSSIMHFGSFSRTAFLVSRYCGSESGRTAIELFAITSGFMMDGCARNYPVMTRLGETSSMCTMDHCTLPNMVSTVMVLVGM